MTNLEIALLISLTAIEIVTIILFSLQRQTVTIFESFLTWTKEGGLYPGYSGLEVIEAQGIILNEAKQNLAFEMSVKDPLNENNQKQYIA